MTGVSRLRFTGMQLLATTIDIGPNLTGLLTPLVGVFVVALGSYTAWNSRKGRKEQQAHASYEVGKFEGLEATVNGTRAEVREMHGDVGEMRGELQVMDRRVSVLETQ